MTKISYESARDFGVWENTTTREQVSFVSVDTGFFNLKNKADGARRIGYTVTITKFTNAAEQVLFRGEYQTTLNGSRYQSGKDSDYYDTQREVELVLAKTAAGALKRYAKLAQDPANKIEARF